MPAFHVKFVYIIYIKSAETALSLLPVFRKFEPHCRLAIMVAQTICLEQTDSKPVVFHKTM